MKSWARNVWTVTTESSRGRSVEGFESKERALVEVRYRRAMHGNDAIVSVERVPIMKDDP